MNRRFWIRLRPPSKVEFTITHGGWSITREIEDEESQTSPTAKLRLSTETIRKAGRKATRGGRRRGSGRISAAGSDGLWPVSLHRLASSEEIGSPGAFLLPPVKC